MHKQVPILNMNSDVFVQLRTRFPNARFGASTPHPKLDCEDSNITGLRTDSIQNLVGFETETVKFVVEDGRLMLRIFKHPVSKPPIPYQQPAVEESIESTQSTHYRSIGSILLTLWCTLLVSALSLTLM